MWKYSIPVGLVTLLFAACNPIYINVKRSKGALPYNEEVNILSSYDTIPKGAYELAFVKVKHNGLGEGCKYDELCNLAQLEARKIGGNIVQVMKHNKYSFLSDCHKITATIYYTNDHLIVPVKKREEAKPETVPSPVEPKLNNANDSTQNNINAKPNE